MDFVETEADFIIVGAGSAGSVLADRLSASGKHRVTVLEAGGTDRRFFVQMPLGYGKLFYDGAVNWLYRAEADPGLAGARDHWPRGKLLGGSSSINAMVWIRGHRADYEDWGAVGGPSWGWDAALAGYRAIEDTEAGADEWRGAGGPLFISANREGLHPLFGNFMAACNEAGLAANPDFNGARQEGAGNYQMTIKGGRRNSAARAFLRPAMRRPEPAGRHRRAGVPCAVRGPPRRGGGIQARRCGACPAGGGRGDPFRRSDQFAADPPAFGGRAGGRSCRGWAFRWWRTILMSGAISATIRGSTTPGG